MAKIQQVAVWPASLMEFRERVETPYRLLDKKAGVIGRAAWWVLNKLKALEPFYETVQRWDYVPHEQKALHEAMLEAVNMDLRYIFEGKAVFIIGGKTFSELTQAPVFREQMMFMTGPFGIGGSGPYSGQLFDIPLHVVPSMVGMAVVPRAIIETKR